MRHHALINSRRCDPFDGRKKIESLTAPLLEAPASSAMRGGRTTPCNAYRYIILLLGCSANVISYTDRGVISLAIVPMAEDLQYMDEAAQGIALSAFFFGYICTQLLGGLLSRRYGPKRIIIGATSIFALATICTPAAARISLPTLFAARMVLGLGEGALLPCLHDLGVAWVAPTERSTAAALMTSGQFLGQAISMLCGAPLIAVRWSDAFYLFGGCGLLWCIIFAALVSNSPDDHRCVSRAELAVIQAREKQQLRAADSAAIGQATTSEEAGGGSRHVQPSSVEMVIPPSPALSSTSITSAHGLTDDSRLESRLPPPHIPWRRVLTNRAAVAIYVAHWCHNWSWYLLLSWLPKFLTQRGADLSQAGFLSMLPPLLAFILSNAGAAIADRLLLRRLRLSLTSVRRILGAFTHLGPSFAMLTLACVPASLCGPGTSATLACVAIGLGALNQSAFWANIMDIAPNHAGILVGISNTMATLPGILCNLSTGYMLEHGLGWPPVLLLGAGLELLAAIVYINLARGEPQF